MFTFETPSDTSFIRTSDLLMLIACKYHLSDDICKRRFQRSKLEDDEKPMLITVQDKTGNCKPKPSKPVLLLVILVTLVVITYTLTSGSRRQHYNYISHAVSKYVHKSLYSHVQCFRVINNLTRWFT